MTLREISSWINRNARYKLTEEQIILIIDMVNKLATDTDLPAFKYWLNTLTVHTQLNYSVADVLEADVIGQEATGDTSGATGTVESYDTTNEYVVLSSVTGDFEDGEVVQVPDSMDITLESSDAVEGYKGPYAFPTSPAVRKMIGITTFTDARLFGTQYVYVDERDDYGLVLPNYDERQFYVPGRLDRFAQTFTFISEPSTDTDDDPYRWVYFRLPDTITDLDADDSKLLVDEWFHMEFIQACIYAGKVGTEDGNFDRNVIEKYFWGWWNRLRKNYTPMGKRSNQINEGNLEISPNEY
jgi:hypothetical protein